MALAKVPVDPGARGKVGLAFGDHIATSAEAGVEVGVVEGLLALLDKGDQRPVNLGNPVEMTLVEFAEAVRTAVGRGGAVRSVRALPENDPKQRRPDITRAKTLLGWQPRVPLAEGLGPTVAYFRSELGL